MSRVGWLAALPLLAGCEPVGPLKHAELKRRASVPHADPIDPAATLITLHADGRRTSQGQPLSLPRKSGVDTAPILLEVDADTRMKVVRDGVDYLCRHGRCNIAFLVDWDARPAGLRLPIPIARGWGYVTQVGPKEVRIADTLYKRLELVMAPGVDGAPELKELNFRLPAEPSNEGPQPWEGPHPAPGAWTRETLKSFLARPDVARLRPYVFLDLGDLNVPLRDVLRCLSELQAATELPIYAELPARP